MSFVVPERERERARGIVQTRINRLAGEQIYTGRRADRPTKEVRSCCELLQ